MPAISLEGISKKYRIYRRQQDRLRELLSFGRIELGRDFWALKDINLKIEPGVSIGLLGRNGAGKSTLLQIISGVLQPTTGTVRTEGRVAALLQLGAGFNPEFTGRENVFMNGLLLGIDRREMLERFDEIEAFADIGEFMNHPVKSYSSGMRARLGFAVAVNVEPDILLVDETLSVGDAVFRHMGVQKMHELKDSGATIVFVSHSMSMVRSFCSEAAVLHKGSLVAHGDTSQTVDYYQALLSNAAVQRGEQTPGSSDGLPKPEPEEDGSEPPSFKENPRFESHSSGLRHGTGEVRIQNVEILNDRDEPVEVVAPDSTLTVRVHARYVKNVDKSIFGIILRNRTGLDVFSTNTKLEKIPIRKRRAGGRLIVDFSFKASLRHGPYSVTASVSSGNAQNHFLDWIDVAATLEIDRPAGRGAFAGLVHLPTEITVFEPERTRKPAS